MKRKWMLALATLPLIILLVFAWRLADKRPQLVARDLKVAELWISPDGKSIVTHGDWSPKSHIIRLDGGSQVSIPTSNSEFFFSPDGTKLYQLNFEFEPQGEKFHQTLVLYDAASGRREGRFQFARSVLLYGALWRDGEVVVESDRQTWHFEARSLRLLGTQKRNKLAQRIATLCPDGETIYWPIGQGKWNTSPYIWTFADLRTGRILWSDGPKPVDVTPVGFSGDGRIVLWSGGKSNGEVVARDTRTGVEKWRLRGPQSSVIALSPDASAVYEARDGKLWKWPR